MEDEGAPDGFDDLVVGDEPALRDLVGCVFGLSDSLLEVYAALLDRPESTARELARETGYEQSTLNRKLATLLERNLVLRERRSLRVGGYAYTYEAIAPERVVELMHRTLDEWTAFMHRRIDDAAAETLVASRDGSGTDSSPRRSSTHDFHELVHGSEGSD